MGSPNDKPLSCTVKNPLLLAVDSKPDFHSGCKIVDISFPSIANPEAAEEIQSVGEIRFQNFYVAFLTVKVKFKHSEQTPRDGPNDQGWRIVLRKFRLMPDPHSEAGAQDIFCLSRKHFSFDLNNLVCVRLILQQPSPSWKEFKLEELKLFRTANLANVPPLPSWVTDDEKKMSKKSVESEAQKEDSHLERRSSGAPDLEQLSTNLQQLWALAEEAAANQTEESLGRYEIDGCYDINLLAYS